MYEKTEKQALNKERIKQLAEEVCRLQYDVTSLAFEKLYVLLLNHHDENPKHLNEKLNKRQNYVSSATKVRYAKLSIDDAWKNSKDHMSECENKHARKIEGYDSVEDVIIEVYASGQIGYFMISGVNELMNQSRNDKDAGHPKLSGCLLQAAYRLDEAVDELSQNY